MTASSFARSAAPLQVLRSSRAGTYGDGGDGALRGNISCSKNKGNPSSLPRGRMNRRAGRLMNGHRGHTGSNVDCSRMSLTGEPKSGSVESWSRGYGPLKTCAVPRVRDGRDSARGSARACQAGCARRACALPGRPDSARAWPSSLQRDSWSKHPVGRGNPGSRSRWRCLRRSARRCARLHRSMRGSPRSPWPPRRRFLPCGDLLDLSARGTILCDELECSLANVEEGKLGQAEQRAACPSREYLPAIQRCEKQTDRGRTDAGCQVDGTVERAQHSGVIGEKEEERVVVGTMVQGRGERIRLPQVNRDRPLVLVQRAKEPASTRGQLIAVDHVPTSFHARGRNEEDEVQVESDADVTAQTTIGIPPVRLLQAAIDRAKDLGDAISCD